MKSVEFSGTLSVGSGVMDPFDTLLLIQEDGYKQDLIARLNEAVLNYGSKVSVRYWIVPEPMERDRVKEAVLRHIVGAVSIEFEAEEYRYSEYTGGTDYNTIFNISRHNLYKELGSSAGKYLLLEVDFTDT